MEYLDAESANLGAQAAVEARKAHFVKFSTALANKKAIAVKVQSILAFLKAWP